MSNDGGLTWTKVIKLYIMTTAWLVKQTVLFGRDKETSRQPFREQYVSVSVLLTVFCFISFFQEFSSFYDFVIGDHGGIIAAVRMWRDQREVW